MTVATDENLREIDEAGPALCRACFVVMREVCRGSRCFGCGPPAVAGDLDPGDVTGATLADRQEAAAIVLR